MPAEIGDLKIVDAGNSGGRLKLIAFITACFNKFFCLAWKK